MGIFEDIRLEPQDHPSLNGESPFGIVCEYHRGAQQELRGDVHYALQISIVLLGAAEAVFGGWRHEFRPGELWWTMCWEPHAYRLTGDRNFVMSVNLHIDDLGNCGPCSGADFLAPFTAPPERRYRPRNDAERAEVDAFARKLLRMYGRRTPNWETHCWLLIHEFILRAAERTAAGQEISGVAPRMARIRKAVALVRQSPVPPTLAEAASACFLSVSRFSDLFRSAMGVSYGQFALRVRLAAAAADVRGGVLPLSEIAERHGFCDASSFCHAFRKVYRCTPGEFRAR